MNETMVTLVGHVATDPALRVTTGGARVTSFRLASTERRFDKGVNGWRDAHTTFFTVTAWRNMAENVAESMEKGHPVVVHGRLRDSSYEAKDGQWRTVLEVEAFALGHDLSRGTASFNKGSSGANVNIVRELEDFGEVDMVTGELRDAPVDDGFAAAAVPADGAADGAAGAGRAPDSPDASADDDAAKIASVRSRRTTSAA